MHRYIVYVVYGAPKFYDQARLSVLTALDLMLKAGRDDLRIAVFADRPGEVPVHPLVQAHQLNPAQLTTWRGPLDYVHRIKLEVLRVAMRQLQAPLLYVDSDTRWLALPDAAFAALTARDNTLVMHVDEGPLGRGKFPSYLKYLQRHQGKKVAGWRVSPGPWHMWNAGVIGLMPRRADKFLGDALALCDYLLPRLTPRNFVEQLAVSSLAADRFKLLALGDVLHHYWPDSLQAPQYLAEVFAALPAGLSVEQQADWLTRLRWDEERLNALRQDPALRRKQLIGKYRASLHKRRIDLRALTLRWRSARS